MPLRLHPLALAASSSARAGRRWRNRPLCQRYRAELASLDRGGGRAGLRRGRAAARRDRPADRLLPLDRLRRAGPSRSFGGSAPAECGAIAPAHPQLEANYAASPPRFRRSGDEARRRQLTAAVEQTCGAGQPAQQQAFGGPRGFFESLFGAPRNAPVPPQPVPGTMPDGVLPEPGDEQRPRRSPARRRPARLRADLRRLLLPARSAARRTRERRRDVPGPLPGIGDAAFSMPGSDDAICRAISLKGKPYTTLPTPSSYQKALRRILRLQEGGRELGA